MVKEKETNLILNIINLCYSFQLIKRNKINGANINKYAKSGTRV